LLVLAVASLLLLLLIAAKRALLATFLLALAGAAAALACLFLSRGSVQVTSLLLLDDPARFFLGVLLASLLLVAVLSYKYLRRLAGNREEFFLLLLLAALGAAVLASSAHFASLFLGLEILSISLYGLIAYNRASAASIEGGVKYFFATAVASAVLLFGIALVYADTGTLVLAEIATRPRGSFYLTLGASLLLIGLALKLALVPFHMWVADVYQGAPAPATAALATISKASVLAAFYRFFVGLGLLDSAPLAAVLLAIAVASMLAGSWLALLQKNVKRLLAYSSIAQVGYLLIPFFAFGEQRQVALYYAAAAYFLAAAGSFGIVTVLSDPGREAESFEDYRGLASRRPWLAGLFILLLLSQAGIPLTMGFTGKFYLFLAAAGSYRWLLAVALLASSALGLFYYLRLVLVLFGRGQAGAQPAASAAEGAVLALITAAVVVLGVLPAPFIGLLQGMVRK
jgi:NADH-quinone oxidoreductase subunit N